MRKIYDYGQIIRAKRQNKNIKAINLAKDLGITPAYLSLIESNQRKPDGDLLLRIQDLLELQKEDLTKRSDPDLESRTQEVVKMMTKSLLAVFTSRRFSNLIESFIDQSAYIIAMDQKGAQWTSESLAEKLIAWSLSKSKFQFLIGGSEGLSSAVLDRADIIWSLSKLTLPHSIARIVLLEQLYRAFMINNNHPYHR